MIRLYNDIAVSLFSSNNIEEINTVVNAELASIEKWLQSNKLSLNIVKTQTIGSAQKLGQINKTSDYRS